MLGITATCKEIWLRQYEIYELIRLYHAIFISALFKHATEILIGQGRFRQVKAFR